LSSRVRSVKQRLKENLAARKHYAKNREWFRLKALEWVEKNRDKVNARKRARRAANYQKYGYCIPHGPEGEKRLKWLHELKSRPCMDCHNQFPTCCMDFDHRIGTVKYGNVSSMFANWSSRKKIIAELAKCDLVCSNCHRIRTRSRKIGNGPNA
jgi:hypothetical protein